MRIRPLWNYPIACGGAGRKDDAVFFFYLGQLRYRAYLLSDPKRDRSLFDAMMSAMGPPINQYAFGDIKALIATIDRVIAWDDATPARGARGGPKRD